MNNPFTDHKILTVSHKINIENDNHIDRAGKI